LTLSSKPDGAEIQMDGTFIGNTPATLKLSSGKHNIRLSQPSLVWEREITVLDASSATVNAVLAMPQASAVGEGTKNR